jgi:hypothetical protein
MGGREQSNSIRTAAKVSCLADEVVSGRDGWVEEGIREVVEVAEVDVGHEDIQVVRPSRLRKVFSISRFGNSIRLNMGRDRGREEVSSVHNGMVAGIAAGISTLPTVIRNRDEVLKRRERGTAVRAFLEDQLFRVLLLLLAGSLLEDQLLGVFFYLLHTRLSHRNAGHGRGNLHGRRSGCLRQHQVAGGARVGGREAQGAEQARRIRAPRVADGPVHS